MEESTGIIDFFNTDEQIEQFSIRTTVFDNHANYLSYLGENPHILFSSTTHSSCARDRRRDLRTRINCAVARSPRPQGATQRSE
jgi:hypothetical protein